ATDDFCPGGNPGASARRDRHHRGRESRNGQVAPESGQGSIAFPLATHRGVTVMPPDELYQAWKQHRSRNDVPANFTENVMASLHARQRQPTWRLGWGDLVLGLLCSRPGKVGICVLGCVVCAVRVLHVLALFIRAFSNVVEGSS